MTVDTLPLANQIDAELERIGIRDRLFHWYAFRHGDDTYYTQIYADQETHRVECVMPTDDLIPALRAMPRLAFRAFWHALQRMGVVFATCPGTTKHKDAKPLSRRGMVRLMGHAA